MVLCIVVTPLHSILLLIFNITLISWIWSSFFCNIAADIVWLLLFSFNEKQKEWDGRTGKKSEVSSGMLSLERSKKDWKIKEFFSMGVLCVCIFDMIWYISKRVQRLLSSFSSISCQFMYSWIYLFYLLIDQMRWTTMMKSHET